MAEVIGRALIRVLPQTAEFAVHLRNDLKRTFQTITDSFAVLATQAVAGLGLALGGVAFNLAGAVALIPAAAAGATVALGALAVGFQGVGKAIKDAGDPKKFAKDLEKLSPEARKAAIAVKDLGVQAGAFRVAVQDALFKDMDATITKLGNVLLPGIKQNFVDIAAEVNHGARAFALFAGSKQTVADLNTVFANTKTSLKSLTPAGIAFSTALRDIVTVGSGFLPILADSLKSVTERFATFIAKARDSGQLSEFFARGIVTLRLIIDILKNVAQSILSVFKTARDAGDGLLESLDRAAKALKNFVTSAEGKTAILNFLNSAKQAAIALAPVLKAVFSVFANEIAPILAHIGVIIGPAVAQFINTLGLALKIAQPGIEALARGFSDLVRGLAPALPAIGRLAAVIGETLGKVLTALAPVLGEVVRVLADALSKALSDPKLIEGLIAMGKAFGDLIIALAPILPSLAQLAGVILKALADVLTAIAPVLADVIKQFVDALLPFLPDLVSAFLDLVKALLPIVKDLLPVFLEIMKALLPIMKPVVEILVFLLKIINPIIQLLAAFLISLIKIVEFVEKVIAAIAKLSGFFIKVLLGDSNAAVDSFTQKISGEAVPEIVDALGEVGSAVVQLDRGFWSFVNSLNLASDDASGANERFAKRTADAFAGAGNAADDVARHLINEVFPGMSGGIFAFARDVATATGDATGANERFARDSAKAFSDFQAAATNSVLTLVNTLFPNFQAIGAAGSGAFQQIADASNRSFLITVRQSRETLLQVAQIFNSADFGAAGTALTESFAQGMVSSRAQLLIQKAARQVVEAVASWFPHSPAEVGPFSGTGWTPFRGQALVEGFAEGITSGGDSLNAALGGLFGDAAGQFGEVRAPNVPLRVGAFGSTGGGSSASAAAGSSAGAAAGDVTEVHVFIGDQELTQLVNGVVVKNNRDVRRRALAGTGRAR